MTFAIRAENLAKRYRLGASAANSTLRDAVVEFAQRFKRGQRRAVSDEFWALRDVSFEIKPGEIVGVMGRNGAGKSTLLKLLARITEPTLGRIDLRGRVASLLEVGTGFHPELTGRENIFLNGSILGMTRREIAARFAEIVGFAELEKFIDTPVKRYSSGMYVRLAFAVAAHLEPEILLVDEVLAVGDAAFQQRCLGKMSDVARGGRTILFVSHNTAALLSLCRRGLLIEQGCVVADGAVESVTRQYLKGGHRVTVGNLATIKDRQGNGRARFTAIGFEDDAGNQIEHAVSGQPLIIVLDYCATDTRALPRCRASVAFYDGLGQALFNCSSELTRREPLNLPLSGTIRCRIPRLPLSQNQYVLTLFLEVNQEIADWILQAVELNVVDGDFYGTGRLYPDGWRGKGVLVPHEWTIGEPAE